MRNSLLGLLLLSFYTFQAQDNVSLNHNIGTTIVDQMWNFSCSSGGVNFGRVFVLEDFNISEDYEIQSAEFGIQEVVNHSGQGPEIIVNIYRIDENFPDSFPTAELLGSSDPVNIFLHDYMILTLPFSNPVTIAPDVDRILVEVATPFDDKFVFAGGTSDTYDFSWYRGPCGPIENEYATTYDMDRPFLNYYITVTGKTLLSVEDQEKKTIRLSPNPTNGEVTLEGILNLEDHKVTIYNNIG